MKLIITIIGILLGVGLVASTTGQFDDEGNFEVTQKGLRRLFVTVPIGLIAVVLFIGLANSVEVIPVNSVGTKINKYTGKIHEDVLPSGVHFRLPVVEKISYLSTELRYADIDDMAVTTKDAQGLTIDIEMQYHIDPTKAVETYKQFKSVPEDAWIKAFVQQRIQRGVQEVASNYTIIEIMGEKRGLFQVEVDKAVAEAMIANHLILHTASVDDMKAPESIVTAIQENAKARQAVETAKQKQEEEKVKNQTKVDKAEADAKARLIEAEAESKANELLAQKIDENLIRYMEAEARQKHGWVNVIGADGVIVDPKGN